MNATELTAQAFERRYAGGADPWAFSSSTYELNRYSILIESLGRPTYGTVYEPGCSIGVLTVQLAGMAQRVIACDFAQSAVQQAQARCAAFGHVEIYCADVRECMTAVPLDLVVLSEIGYYFESAELARWVDELVDGLTSGGELLAAHWLGTSSDHVLHGDDVHQIISGNARLSPLRADRYAHFRLDSWVKS